MSAVDSVVERAKKAVPNAAFAWLAEAVVKQNPYAVDYIEQAPVLSR